MSIRIDVQMDHGSASIRYVATASLDGKHLHEVGKVRRAGSLRRGIQGDGGVVERSRTPSARPLLAAEISTVNQGASDERAGLVLDQAPAIIAPRAS